LITGVVGVSIQRCHANRPNTSLSIKGRPRQWRRRPFSRMRAALPKRTAVGPTSPLEVSGNGPIRNLAAMPRYVWSQGQPGLSADVAERSDSDPKRTRHPRWPMSVRRSGLSADSVRWSGNDRFRGEPVILRAAIGPLHPAWCADEKRPAVNRALAIHLRRRGSI
jgi:hypothetical protein